MTVAENPLAEFNHCRPFLVFHLRTLETIDGQAVTDRERSAAKDRFEQGGKTLNAFYKHYFLSP